MIPTSLPVPTIAPTAGPPANAQRASTDFLLMLAQLVGASAPRVLGSMPPTSASTAVIESIDDAAPETDPADLIAMLSLSLPVMAAGIQAAVGSAAQPPVLKPTADALQSQSRGIATATALLTDLTVTEQTPSDEPAGAFDSVLYPATETQPGSKVTSGQEPMLSRPVHSPVGSDAWTDEIAARLTLMAGHGKQTASLRLSPEHLGPLEIRITIQDDQASVWFGASHADTRAAIETALPRLRELFESQGLSLTDAGVFREPPREQPTPASLSDRAASGDDSSTVVVARVRLGLVDTYA